MLPNKPPPDRSPEAGSNDFKTELTDLDTWRKRQPEGTARDFSALNGMNNRLPANTAVAIDRNMCDYWMSFGQQDRGVVHQDRAMTWSYTGGPFFNRILDVLFNDGEVEQRIRDTHEFFRRQQAAATWLITPSSRPEDVAGRLRSHGCVLQERWLGMAATSNQIEWSQPGAPGVTMVRVGSDEDLRSWASIVTGVYRLPGAAGDMLFRFFSRAESEVHDRWRHYLAFLDGQPVATASLFLGTEEAGIYLVGTLPEHQRNGLARMLTLHAVAEAIDDGYDLLVLQATPEGHRLYRRLGFQTSHSIDAYRWDPSPYRRALARLMSVRS